MANDTIIISPEYNNVGRREAMADEVIICGTFVKVTETGFANADPQSGNNSTIAVENTANHSDIYYEYAQGENVFAQAVPNGCLVQIRAVQDTYVHGQPVEIGAGGYIQAVTSGEIVGYVALRQGLSSGLGNLIIIQLA